jgi:hypothetical protein
MLVAAMAGETRHVSVAIGEFRINLARHGDHHASGCLFGLVIAGEISLHVTSRAFAAQRRAKRGHGCTDFFGFEQFKVLWSRRRTLFFAGRWRFLGKQRNNDEQSKKCPHCVYDTLFALACETEILRLPAGFRHAMERPSRS